MASFQVDIRITISNILFFFVGISNKLLMAAEAFVDDTVVCSNTELIWLWDDSDTGIRINGSGWTSSVEGYTESAVYSNSRSGKITSL